MPQSELRLIRRRAEYIPKERLPSLPRRLRGVCVLCLHRPSAEKDQYDVVYVGMASAGRHGGIRGRVTAHKRNKGDL